MIGARPEAIATAEDRERFKEAMADIGLAVPESGFAHEIDEALVIARRIGWPIMVRPSYILGGAGTGIARDVDELVRLAGEGIAASPIGEILVERSVAGWKEFELEVMRDRADNCVVVCSIENLDPMGVHTGDSITVAPQQTLSDVEYQAMRDDAFTVLRRVGVETGGSNVQFAVNPDTGERLVIEMNPRVSRSSALASKATGFPIAKIAARLAVGYTLDEIPNDITRGHPGELRADDRLRGHEDPALGLREAARRPRPGWAPGCSQSARPWRSDATSRSPSKRPSARSNRRAKDSRTTATASSRRSPATNCGSGARRRRPSDSTRCTRCSTAALTTRRSARRTGIDAWFIDQLASISRT